MWREDPEEAAEGKAGHSPEPERPTEPEPKRAKTGQQHGTCQPCGRKRLRSKTADANQGAAKADHEQEHVSKRVRLRTKSRPNPGREHPNGTEPKAKRPKGPEGSHED